MAASKAIKIEAARLLATGMSEQAVADAVGVSRASITRWKKQQNFEQMHQSATEAVAKVSLEHHGQRLLAQIDELQQREPALRDAVWMMLESMSRITNGLLERLENEPELIGVRSLPALMKGVVELSACYCALDDRISGMGVARDALIKMAESSPTTPTR